MKKTTKILFRPEILTMRLFYINQKYCRCGLVVVSNTAVVTILLECPLSLVSLVRSIEELLE